MKNTVYLTAAIILTSLTTAAPQTTAQGDPGIFGASHPLHQAEVITDNLGVSFGLMNSSNVAQERLAEANQAAVRGKQKAQEKALNQYNKIAEKAQNIETNQDIQGLLEQVRNRTPEDAGQGLQTALNEAENMAGEVEVDVPDQAGKKGNGMADRLDDLGRQARGLLN